MIDVEFEDYSIKNANTEDNGLEKMRRQVSAMYNKPYGNVENTYGRSNDDVGEDDPFSREVRPYLAPTEQTDSGYRGLEPPVG